MNTTIMTILDLRLSCQDADTLRAALSAIEGALGSADSTSRPYQNRNDNSKRMYVQFIVPVQVNEPERKTRMTSNDDKKELFPDAMAREYFRHSMTKEWAAADPDDENGALDRTRIERALGKSPQEMYALAIAQIKPPIQRENGRQGG